MSKKEAFESTMIGIEFGRKLCHKKTYVNGDFEGRYIMSDRIICTDFYPYKNKRLCKLSLLNSAFIMKKTY